MNASVVELAGTRDAVAHLRTLLGVVERLSEDCRFLHALDDGPSQAAQEEAVCALRLAGFVPSAESVAGPPSFAEMMATVLRRSGGRQQAGAILRAVRS